MSTAEVWASAIALAVVIVIGARLALGSAADRVSALLAIARFHSAIKPPEVPLTSYAREVGAGNGPAPRPEGTEQP